MAIYIGTSELKEAYVGALLPSTYQQVEYIQSSGTQRIDTGVYGTNTTVFQIKIMALEEQGDVIFGAHPGSDTQDFRLFNASLKIYFDLPGSSGTGNRISGSSWQANTLKEFECGNFYVKNVGESSNLISGSTVGSFTTSQTLKLNKGSGSIAKTRCYYIKIWNGGTMVRNMLPCYRISDTVVGMYDLVNGVFYTNSGTGTFTKGSNV